MIDIKIKLLTSTAMIPKYARVNDAGMDLMADEFIVIPGGEWRLIGTGIALELPDDVECQIRSRSGLAAKYGVTVLNSPGTVDPGYRGEIMVILVNHSAKPFQITQGMRIAQMVFAPIVRPHLLAVSRLSESERGVNGFGSTGLSEKNNLPKTLDR